MAHKGRTWKFGPPRDLCQVDGEGMARGLPEYMNLVAGNLFNDFGLFEISPPIISDPITWSYDEGWYKYRWAWTQDGHDFDVTLKTVILLNNPDILETSVIWLFDTIDVGPSTMLTETWTDNASGILDFIFESSPTPPGESSMWLFYYFTPWSETP